jgi:tetratricopeptide (TPR) repeat protein/peroxiredoxin
VKREKKPENPDLLSQEPSRRSFLIRCCQGAALLPTLSKAALSGFAIPDPSTAFARESAFHLHPQYLTPLPMDAVLAKVQAGSDAFVSEKYHDQLAAVLGRWRKDLLQEPPNLGAIASVLTEDFTGSTLLPSESRLLRRDAILEIRRHQFSGQANVTGERFIEQLQGHLSSFSKFIAADFQITGIDLNPAVEAGGVPAVLTTTVRYELVGSGVNNYREQRVGDWRMTWRADGAGKFRLARWVATQETESRCASPTFADVTGRALGGNSSYGAQLALGVDYWRTVLDGASGIDIYGHNGVSFGDIDNDGLDDLYVCQPSGLPNRLYRNRGDGTFEDVTESAGVGLLENSACALFADIDNDGRQDLIVVRAGNGPLLFMNDGGCKFREKPHAFRFANPPQGTFTGAAIADYDCDGWLDIYFCLYTYYQGADQYRYPLPYDDAENGPPNFLMRNNRDGTFADITAESGLNANNTRYSFCCGWNDFNGDGWPDLYVVNDFGRKNLYRNNGDGTFTDVAADMGMEDIGAGMSVCWLDCDNNGWDDLYVGDMWTAAGVRVAMQDVFQKNAAPEVRAHFRKHAMGNSLFQNEGAGKFRNATAASGAGIGRWAWACDAWDFDHDGFPDLYISNGMVSGPSREGNDLNSFFWRQVVANSPLARKPSQIYEQAWTAINELIRSDVSWSGYERNIVYANNRDGTFSDVSGALGLDFIEDGRSFALADCDYDGRLEVVLKNRNGPQVRVLKNVIRDLPPSISFRLHGTKSNRDAIGAVVKIEAGSFRQSRTVQAGSGFLCQHSKEVFFGLGDAQGSVRASIRWPSGHVQQLEGLLANHRVWVEEGAEGFRAEPFKAAQSVAAQGMTEAEQYPNVFGTWMLAPVAAPEFALADLSGESQTVSLSHLRGQPALLFFWTSQMTGWEENLEGLAGLARTAPGRIVAIKVDGEDELERIRATARKRSWPFAVVQASADLSAIYNILFRQIFDRHRDLPLPTSFLLDSGGNIVKVYQGASNPVQLGRDFREIPTSTEQRVTKALPFAGIWDGVEFPRNYLSLGSVYYQRGYYEQAGDFFRRALDHDASSAEALYGLGSVYLQQQKNDEAQRAFERATQLRASYPGTLPNAWNNLGLLAAHEQRMAEAVSYFEKALQVSPDHPIALLNLGNAFRQMRRWDEARATLQKAAAVEPENPEANYGLAMVYAQLNDSETAYEYLQSALKLRPDYPEALNNLGILYLRTERRDQAVETFERCIRVAPKFDQAYLNLARVYALEGSSGKARSVLQQLLIQQPGHEQAEKALAELP